MAVYRRKVRVQPGGKIEAEFPELEAGKEVEIEVTESRPSQEARLEEKEIGVLEWLDSLPPGPRSASTWEEVERNFQEERNSWD